MDTKTLELLTQEIERELKLIETLEIGSQEYSKANDGLCKLYEQKNKIELAIMNSEMEAKKMEAEAKLDDEKLKFENIKLEFNKELEQKKIELEAKKLENDVKAEEEKVKIEERKIKKDKTDIYVKNGVILALGIFSGMINIWGGINSWDYEKTDSYTSFTSKAFMNRLFKK